MDNFEHFFADVVDGGDEEGECFFGGEGGAFADEALLAGGVLGVVDAIGGESSGRAFEGFMAIGEAEDEEGMGLREFVYKVFFVDAVEEEVAISCVGLRF